MLDVEGFVDQALQAIPAFHPPSTSPCESVFSFPSNTAHYMVKLPEGQHSNVCFSPTFFLPTPLVTDDDRRSPESRHCEIFVHERNKFCASQRLRDPANEGRGNAPDGDAQPDRCVCASLRDFG